MDGTRLRSRGVGAGSGAAESFSFAARGGIPGKLFVRGRSGGPWVQHFDFPGGTPYDRWEDAAVSRGDCAAGKEPADSGGAHANRRTVRTQAGGQACGPAGTHSDRDWRPGAGCGRCESGGGNAVASEESGRVIDLRINRRRMGSYQNVAAEAASDGFWPTSRDMSATSHSASCLLARVDPRVILGP